MSELFFLISLLDPEAPPPPPALLHRERWPLGTGLPTSRKGSTLHFPLPGPRLRTKFMTPCPALLPPSSSHRIGPAQLQEVEGVSLLQAPRAWLSLPLGMRKLAAGREEPSPAPPGLESPSSAPAPTASVFGETPTREVCAVLVSEVSQNSGSLQCS